MAQETIDKIINIQFKYTDLVNGWAEASKAISDANAKLNEFKKTGDAQGVAKQTQLIKALRTEMNQYTREIQANVREEVKAEGSINQLNAKIAKLTAQYNAMSGEVRKSSVGEALAKEIADVQTEVNKANEAVLNFRNNVGNYASAAKGFGTLNMQVQQIARELPSLTMSFSQFFLAISNNLPMFADELQRAKTANDALKKSGAATIPVFKQIVSSIFSWQTALVVGITLLSAYGSEIVDWIKGLFKAKEASISMEEAAQNVNKALEEGGSGIGEQIAKVKSLQTAWNELGSDLDARKKFITDNKDAFDDLGVKVTDVNDAENLLVRNTDVFIDALNARAQAAAGMKLAAEAYEKALIEEQKTREKIAKGFSTTYISGGSPTTGGAKYTTETRPYTDAEKEELMAPVRALEAQAGAYITLSTAKQKDAAQTLENAKIESKATNEQKKAVEEAINKRVKLLQKEGKSEIDIELAVLKQREEIKKSAATFADDIDKEFAKVKDNLSKTFKQQIAEQQQIYRNRIDTARLQDGEIGAARETLAIYQEQLRTFDSMKAQYQAAGMTDLEIQSLRITARQNVQAAEEQIANIQFQNTQRQLSVAGQTAGALSSMFEALGGESEKYAAFAKSMAVMQVILTQSIAIAKAVQGGAEYPFPLNIIAVAGSVAAITAAIASSVSTVKSTEVPKYASGGLISGPGSGTSDSIPAMLSNGEAVMTANAVNEWGAMLSAMNVSSGGNAINVSNLPQRGDGMRGMERMMQRVMMNMPAPVVSVVDINKGQRKVKVQDNISKLGRKKYA